MDAATILPQKREDDAIIVGAKFQKREDDAIIVDQPLAKFQKQEDDAIIVDQPPANFQKLHQPQPAVDRLDTNVYEKIERDEIDMEGTAFAFLTIDLSGTESLKVVVDSRACSEKKGVITIERVDKFYNVTPNIVALMVGSQNRCYELRSNLRDWVRAFDKVITVTVLEVVNHIENYLKELLNKNPEIQHDFENIVAGYDTIEEFQIYRISMMDGKVNKVKSNAFTSMGSGAYYATSCFTSHYTLTCADDVSEEFALKTLFDASYYDKRTDGNIKCFPITIHGAQRAISINSLEAYLRFYADYDEKCVLFLAYNPYKKTENDEKMVKILNPILSVDLLAGYFRKYGRVIAAHCVSTRVHQIAHHPKATFYFHRIIFCSPGEADEACKEIHKHAQPNDSETIPLKPFSHVLEELDRKLLVMKASISVLEHIIKHSAEAEDPPKT